MSVRNRRTRVSHERWLVSYADFITLLFAFFVVLYAFAKSDERKQVEISAAVQAAFRSLGISAGKSAAIDQPKEKLSASDSQPSLFRDEAIESVRSTARIHDDLEQVRRELEHRLSAQIGAHTVSISLGHSGLVISLREAGFFDSGSATPRPASIPTLKEIAATLGHTPYDVRVEGHTDDVPIHTAEFDSNWELSAARATHIARLFLELRALPPNRLSAAGYAAYHPVTTNATPEGRAQNRRVDLVVFPHTEFDFAGSNTVASSRSWARITDGDEPATP